MKTIKFLFAVLASVTLLCSFSGKKIDVILDTDANNELDDQHAIAYMLLNQDTFKVLGITTNVTIGGGIDAQMDEVKRVCALMGRLGRNIDVLAGATGRYRDILDSLSQPDFDGHEAVDFIIEKALKHSPEKKLTIIPVGKLTNVALALKKEPKIASRIKVVWLGSNFPDGSEHNLSHDPSSANVVINSDVEFYMAVCRVGKPSGTWAVRISKETVENEIAGKGPHVSKPVTGRHGGDFHCFGDYSLNLFENTRLGKDNGRALYDMACVAVVKNPQWCESYTVPAQRYTKGQWNPIPKTKRTITILNNFNSEAIISDFVTKLSSRR